MIKSVLSLLLLFYSASAMAQFGIVDLNDTSEMGGEYIFPVLQSARQPEAAKKINQLLQMSELGFVIGPSTKNPLANLKHEDEYRYSIISNTANIFSLEITTGHVGAGYHYQFRNYSFDARTGKTIDQKILFTPSGQIEIRQALFEAWKESVKENLDDSYFGEDYKKCLDDAASSTEMEIFRMTVAEKGVQLWGAGCLDGSSSQQDQTIGPHFVPYYQLESMLTPYGISLFTGAPAPKPSVALHQAKLSGKIDGKYAITLTFSPPNPSGLLKGVIVYTKYNSPIQLSGTIKGNKVVLHEMDKSNVAVSDIDCTWDGKNLTGTFKNLKLGKVMPFAATAINK